LKKITILIPIPKTPDSVDTTIRQFKNIFEKLKQKYEVELIWLVFQPNKIEKTIMDGFKVLDFHNYNNAIEVLEKIKPDLIYIHGLTDFATASIAIAGKFKKIPVIESFFFSTHIIKTSSWSIFKKRLRMFFSNRILTNISDDENKKGVKKFILNQYIFFFNTIKQTNLNVIHKIKLILLFPFVRLYYYIAPASFVSGDLYLCSIPDIRNELIKLGYKKSNVVVVGDMSFDAWYSIIKNEIAKPNVTSKKIVLFALSPMHESGLWKKSDEENLIINTIKKIEKNNEFSVVLKIHPTNSLKQEYEEILSKNGLKTTIYQKEDLIKLMKESDFMITYGSSATTLFSVLFKKPTISLDLFPKYSKFNAFQSESVMTICRDINDLTNKLKESESRIIENKNYEKYIEKHLGRFDGKSSERAANAIINLLEK